MDDTPLFGKAAFSPVCRAIVTRLAGTADPGRRRKILTACVKIARPWAEEVLWEALADPNEGLRDIAVKGLCERPGSLDPGWGARRLRRPPWYARSSALAVIGRRKLREALPEIDSATGDANVDVRRAAAEALGLIGGDAAVRLLVRLRKDASPYVRTAAEEAIARTSAVRFS
jgi:HEAT repeat protein